MRNETAGIGDPYWFEWTIGLIHALDMLDSANGIESVTFQDTDAQGLDDVVVFYHDGSIRRIQVKHTREGDSLTFGDLTALRVRGEGRGGTNRLERETSLLRSLASAWNEARAGGKHCQAELYTNRSVSRRWATHKMAKCADHRLRSSGRT